MIHMDNETWAKIEQINHLVNQQPYKTDLELYGKPEFWTIMSGHGGDCEDYALTKRQKLIEAGFDPHDLLPAVGWTNPKDENSGHCVLLVQTDDGAYVLDNNNGWVLPWQDSKVSIKKWDRRADSHSTQWIKM